MNIKAIDVKNRAPYLLNMVTIIMKNNNVISKIIQIFFGNTQNGI